jgi:hypothetical protein
MRVGLTLLAAVVVGCAGSSDSYLAEQIAKQDAAAEDTRRQGREDARREISAATRAREERQAARREDEVKLVKGRPAPPSSPTTSSDSMACSLSLTFKSCEGAADLDACRSDCKAAIGEAIEKLISVALDSCVNAYTALSTPAPPGPTCQLVFPAGADPKGDGSGVPASGLAKANEECTKVCREQGTKLLADAKEHDRAAQTGQALVLSYKRCMLSVDKTRDAIQYRLHDRALYQDLMGKADKRCRIANKCDWLEANSDEFSCDYGN